MKFLDRDVKKMSSLSYAEYYEGVQSHECKECRAPIEHKTDYLLDNNEVSELPQVYLLCNCSIWLPLEKDLIPFDNQRVLTGDDLMNKYVWHLRNPNPSKYVNNNEVYFTKCQKKEKDFFLQSHIKANIDPDQKMGEELESLSKDYYKLCSDTIDLNLKLGLLNVFLNHTVGHHWISMRSGLENSINDLIQYSSPIFWTDYVITYFDSCIVRICRLMEKNPKPSTNCYRTYKSCYLEHYPEKRSKSGGICKLNEGITTTRNWSTAHVDVRFNSNLEELQEPLALLYDEYTNKVLKSINTLNEMQGLKIVFSYDPGKLCLDKSIARPILRIIDNVLKRYVESFSEAAKQLCMEIMQDEKGSVWTIPETPERTRLVINGGDYITDQDSQEAQREKWKAFGELEKAGILSVKSVGTTNPSTEYRINRALAKNISVN